jgi:hypothetical protein
MTRPPRQPRLVAPSPEWPPPGAPPCPLPACAECWPSHPPLPLPSPPCWRAGGARSAPSEHGQDAAAAQQARVLCSRPPARPVV